MRKLTFIMAIIFAIIFQFQSQAGWLIPDPEETFTETAKSAMASVVENTKSIYENDMSETAFLNVALKEIPVKERSREIVNYFKRVYYYHHNGMTNSDIHNQENGETLMALANLASKRGSVESAFFNDAKNPAIPAFKPFKWWLKRIIAVIELLLTML